MWSLVASVFGRVGQQYPKDIIPFGVDKYMMAFFSMQADWIEEINVLWSEADDFVTSVNLIEWLRKATHIVNR